MSETHRKLVIWQENQLVAHPYDIDCFLQILIPHIMNFFELAIVEKERAIFKIGLDRVNHRESAPGNSQYKSYFFRCFKIEHKIKLIQNAFCLGQ